MLPPVLVAVLALAPLARAQEPAPAPAETALDPAAPPPGPLFPPSFLQGYAWFEAGPRSAPAITDVALHPARDDVWAATADDGAVWVTVDDGSTWLAVLGPLAAADRRDEELFGEVQARIEELGAEVDVPDASAFEDDEGAVDTDALEDALEEAARAAEEVADEVLGAVQSELQAGVAIDRPAEERVRPRLWFTRTGLLVVARADGLRVSEDLGNTWVVVLEEPVTALAELPDGRFVAGTPTGLRASPTLARWTPLAAFGELGVHDLVWDGGLYAATAEGLWYTPDLVVWRRLAAWIDEALTARPIAVAPEGTAEPRPLVLGAVEDLWRALDPVASPANGVFGGPIPGATAIARRDLDGLLIAASAAGPFESTDGGASWKALRRGLPDGAEAQDVEVRGGRVLLASASGLWELRPVPAELDLQPIELEPWIPLPTLVDAATLRPELTAKVGRRWVAAFVPALTLEGGWSQRVGDDWDADTWTIRTVDTSWFVEATLTWRPNRQPSSTGFFDAEELGDDLQLLVVDDEVVLIEDDVSPQVLAATVSRGAALYRNELAETVSNLWTVRQRLALESALGDDDPLIDRVERALRLAEVEARLDALTDGAVSAWDPNGGGAR